MYAWWEERTHVLVFLRLCAVNMTTCMTVLLLHERSVYLGTIWAPFPFHRNSAFLPCGSCKQPNKQTNKHMGTQTPYYRHIADAAWFGLYFSRCHSNGKPGSKSEYPLWCSTPPYGKIIVTVRKAWSVSPTSPFQLQFSRDPPETCHMPVRAPRRSQASSIGNEETPSLL